MTLTPIHLGILQDLARRGCFDLNECSTWTQDRLIEIIMLDGSPLISVSDDHVVMLTAAGRKAATDANHIPHPTPHGNSLRA